MTTYIYTTHIKIMSLMKSVYDKDFSGLYLQLLKLLHNCKDLFHFYTSQSVTATKVCSF